MFLKIVKKWIVFRFFFYCYSTFYDIIIKQGIFKKIYFMDSKVLEKKMHVNKEELAVLIGESIKETYGVVGLTTVKSLRSQLVILKKENYVDGVMIYRSYQDKEKFDLDVHLIVAFGVKVNEVVNEVSKRIAYEVNKRYGNIFSHINVYVEDLLDL